MATMFVTDEMIKRAKELADELFYDFECIGIRVQDGIPFELGNLDHTSKVWDNGEETEYISKNGTKYHVFNINGILRVFKGFVERKVTKEIKQAFELV